MLITYYVFLFGGVSLLWGAVVARIFMTRRDWLPGTLLAAMFMLFVAMCLGIEVLS